MVGGSSPPALTIPQFDTFDIVWQYDCMSRKLLLLCSWFPFTFILLFINLTMLFQYVDAGKPQEKLSTVPHPIARFQLAASSGTSQVLSASIVSADARAYLVEEFLRTHKSPMAPFASVIVEEADKNSIDFRLITAIAMCESNAGKRMPKKDEFNAFGIAVYTGQNIGKAFDSWPHAIQWVSQYISKRYYQRGISDLTAIGEIWAPPSAQNGHSWTNCVESFMNEII